MKQGRVEGDCIRILEFLDIKCFCSPTLPELTRNWRWRVEEQHAATDALDSVQFTAKREREIAVFDTRLGQRQNIRVTLPRLQVADVPVEFTEDILREPPISFNCAYAVENENNQGPISDERCGETSHHAAKIPPAFHVSRKSDPFGVPGRPEPVSI